VYLIRFKEGAPQQGQSQTTPYGATLPSWIQNFKLVKGHLFVTFGHGMAGNIRLLSNKLKDVGDVLFIHIQYNVLLCILFLKQILFFLTLPLFFVFFFSKITFFFSNFPSVFCFFNYLCRFYFFNIELVKNFVL
jgi:hypothetical protein